MKLVTPSFLSSLFPNIRLCKLHNNKERKARYIFYLTSDINMKMLVVNKSRP